MSKNWFDELQVEAEEVAKKAYAPYSKFKVGCAGVSTRGNIYRGCNIESVSYGLTVCAEMGMLGAYIAGRIPAIRGEKLSKLVVVSNGKLLTPCGRCRELLYEHAPAAQVLLPGGIVTVEKLLPQPFLTVSSIPEELVENPPFGV